MLEDVCSTQGEVLKKFYFSPWERRKGYVEYTPASVTLRTVKIIKNGVLERGENLLQNDFSERGLPL